MSHTVYTTTGIILSRLIKGEANLFLYILTLEYGIVAVSVQAGLRSAKFSPACNVLTQGLFDIIKTRQSWKLVGVSLIRNSILLTNSVESLQFGRLVAAYTLKYIGVEEDPDDSAYRLLEQVLQKTSKQKPNSNWFDAYRYQLLTILGYIDSTEKPKDRETLRLLIQQAEYSANIDSQ